MGEEPSNSLLAIAKASLICTFKAPFFYERGLFCAPLIMFISVAFGIDPFVSLALFLVSFLMIMGIYPFFIELTDERGPMW